jgi:hypothetical protein
MFAISVGNMIKSRASLVAFLLASTLHAAGPKAPEAPAVFEQLKALAGSWRGSGGKEENAGGIDYRVTANGSVVMETMFPGTPQETVSMYFLDRGRLRLTQYSPIGNQPEMIYDRKHSTPGEFVFQFDGGRGFSMRDDPHLHDGSLKISDAHRLEANWNLWSQGRPAGVHHFVLTRTGKP